VYTNESVTGNSYLNKSDMTSFLSLFKKEAVITDHSVVNGYANAWYVDKKGTYTITLEFLPQRIFTLSLLVSALAFVVTIGLYIFIVLKNEKNKK
jgi:hypothetical protein